MDNSTKIYVCHHCGEQFTIPTALKRHNEEIHNEDKSYKCGTCDKTFKREYDMNRHEMTHVEGKLYQYEFYDQSYTANKNLKTYIEAYHIIDKNYKYNMCEKIFKTKTNLNYHIETKHTQITKCDQCPSTFIHRKNLKQHMKIHTGENLYLCEECGKRFINKNYLNDHRLVHSNKKPYGCGVCGKAYKRKRDLNQHIILTEGH